MVKKAKASVRKGAKRTRALVLRTKSGRIIMTSPAKSATTRVSWSKAFAR
jgi:hypothetical protein